MLAAGVETRVITPTTTSPTALFPSLEQRAEELRRQDGDGGRDGLPYGVQRSATDEGRREGQGRTPSYPRLISPQQPSVRRPFVCPVHSTPAQTE